MEPFKYLLKSVNKMLHFNTALTGLYTITAKSVKSAGKLTTSARAVSPFDVVIAIRIQELFVADSFSDAA